MLLVNSTSKGQALELLDMSTVHSLSGRADIRRPMHHCYGSSVINATMSNAETVASVHDEARSRQQLTPCWLTVRHLHPPHPLLLTPHKLPGGQRHVTCCWNKTLSTVCHRGH